MLVVTRKSKDKLTFPEVGIAVHFLRIQAGQVKVGVDAPKDISIVRGEIENTTDIVNRIQKCCNRLPAEMRHEIRNDLNEISVGLHLYRELMAAGMADEASEIFDSMRHAVDRIDSNDAIRRIETSSANENKTVVLIEDVANERELLASFLGIHGYNVIAFKNGEEAIEYLQQGNHPKIVLVDMHLPMKSGADVVRALSKGSERLNTKVFAVSGTSPEENGLTIGSEGVDEWFPKPLNPSTLIDAMSQALRN